MKSFYRAYVIAVIILGAIAVASYFIAPLISHEVGLF